MSSDDERPDFAWGDGAEQGPRRHARKPIPVGLLISCATAALVAVAGIVVALVLVGGSASKSLVQSSPVTLAADVTTHEAGFKFTLAVSAALGGQSLTVDGSGSMTEGTTPSGTITMSIAGQTVKELIAYPDLYLRSPALGSGWFKVDVSSIAHGLGSSGASLQNSDPTQTLSFLEATGTVTNVGEEPIRGVATTHYHALVALDRLAAAVAPNHSAVAAQLVATLERLTGSTTLPIDVWVDAQHRVRQIVLAMPVSTPSGSLSESVTMDFFDFGPQAPPVLPAASDVTDMTSQLSNAALSLGHTL